MKTPKMPKVAAPAPAPPIAPPPEIETLEETKRNEYMRRLLEARRKGMSSTIVAGALGNLGSAKLEKKKLLGA